MAEFNSGAVEELPADGVECRVLLSKQTETEEARSLLITNVIVIHKLPLIRRGLISVAYKHVMRLQRGERSENDSAKLKKQHEDR